MQPQDIFNLGRYPLNDLDSPAGSALVKAVREQLGEDGCCSLDGFVTDRALEIMAEQAKKLADLAFPGPTSVSPYFFNYRIGEGMRVNRSHPIKRKGKRNLRQVAADLIPGDHLLSILFHSPLMTGFLSRVLQVPVYRNRDKYQSLNISFMDRGGCQQWHFDSGNMVTTLLLQAPESGGNFEYAPAIRSDQSENFDEVRKVLDGHSKRIKRLELRPGSLNLFRGHYSLHRVTEVQGSTERIQGILGYSTTPNLAGKLESSILHYGPRVAGLESISAT